MKILTELCSVPTAPFAEHRVIEYIQRYAAARPMLKLRRDRFNNLMLELPGKSKSPRLVFVAHMDHPGMIARRMRGRNMLEADFYGGVRSDFLRGAKVRFFDGDREIPGVISSISGKPYPDRVKVRLRFRVDTGAIGMLDQGTSRIKNGKFYSRVCDDLAGAASALTLLDELLKNPPRSTIAVLLTRAEEDAFIGAIATVLYPKLLKRSDRVISIECSSMQPQACMGGGVVLRVGDRTSIFNSAFMYFLAQQAEALAKIDRRFKFQRSLMPGGTCEATVFDAYGYTTGAICVPLGNYHNMDRARRKIAPEFVDVDDWKNMVKLFVQITQHAHEFEPGMKPLKQKIETRFRKREKLILSPLPSGEG